MVKIKKSIRSWYRWLMVSTSVQMIAAETHFTNRQLWILLTDDVGLRDECRESGQVIESALLAAFEIHGTNITEVVIDYSNATYSWGDSPLWSVSEAIRRDLKIRFIARDNTYDRLQELLSFTNMGLLIHLERTGNVDEDETELKYSG